LSTEEWYIRITMITNPQKVREFETDYSRSENLTLEQRFAILDGLYELARQLGHFNGENVLDGIDTDIKLARALNADVPIPPF